MATNRKKSFRERGFISRILFSRLAIVILCLLIQAAILFVLFLKLSNYSIPILGSFTVLSVILVIHIINTDTYPAYKLAWIIPITLLPALGSLLYLYVKIDIGSRAAKKVLNIVEEETTPYVHTNPEVMAYLQEENQTVAQMAHYIEHTGGYAAYQNSNVTYYPLGDRFFPALVAELEKAERFIFMEYFIIEEGTFWDAVLDVLKRKAKDGVEVRVMYDDLGSLALVPRDYPKQLESYGIRACAYSRLRVFLSTQYNNRDHRKITVIDGKVAFSGGINLADEYINVKHLHGHWKDTAFQVEGEAVQGFTLLFLQMWNVPHFGKRDDYQTYLPPMTNSDAIHSKGVVIPYGDGPHNEESVAERVYIDMIQYAKKRISIMTPYFIVDNDLLQTIIHAAKRGVEVNLLVPHIPDKWFAIVIARSYYPVLLKAGVHVHEYTPGFVHAKMFLADDDLAVVGTINLDFRSLYLHYECGALIYRDEVLKEIAKDFEDTFAISNPVTIEEYHRTRLFDRVAGRVLRMFAPLL